MKKNKKIVFISQPTFTRKRLHNKPKQNLAEDLFYIGNGLGHFIASYIIEKYTDIQIEVWRIDNRVSQLETKHSSQNILGKVYPLHGKTHLPYNIQFIRDLKKEVKASQCIIWFDGLHNKFFQLIAFIFRNEILVSHSLGGKNLRYKYHETKRLIHLIAMLLERKLAMRNMNCVFVASTTEYEYFRKELPVSKLTIQYTAGINFKRWQVIDQQEARKILGLPNDRPILLQAGRAFNNKGTHVTLKTWESQLKSKNIDLYLVGVQPYDELFEKVQKSGCMYQGVVHHEDIKYWMAAADVYIYPPFDPVTLNFAGIGYAPLEALASGTPLVATTAKFLEEYSIDENEYKDIIRIPRTESDVGKYVLDLIYNKPAPEECNRFVHTHFHQEYLFTTMRQMINTQIPDFFN